MPGPTFPGVFIFQNSVFLGSLDTLMAIGKFYLTNLKLLRNFDLYVYIKTNSN